MEERVEGREGMPVCFYFQSWAWGCVWECSGGVCQRNEGRRNLQDFPEDLATGFRWQILWIVTWGYKKEDVSDQGELRVLPQAVRGHW